MEKFGFVSSQSFREQNLIYNKKSHERKRRGHVKLEGEEEIQEIDKSGNVEINVRGVQHAAGKAFSHS